jgi:hypothetical protein
VAAAAAAAAAAGSNSSNVLLTRDAAESLAWVKGLLWTMSMYFAGREGSVCVGGGGVLVLGGRACRHIS